jgi:hypothetical protein
MAGRRIESMKGPGLFAILCFAAALAPAQEISGDWHGSVEVPNDAPLRLALHIANPNTASVDSADEGVTGLPVDSIHVNGTRLGFEIKSISGVYQGTLTPDGSRITGTWSQDGGLWPLNWERGEDPANLTQPISAAEARHRGQACAQWFYEGKLTDLWLKLSPVVRQAFGSERQLAEFQQHTLHRLGAETRTLSESVTPAGDMQVYRRTAEFQRSQRANTLQFAFDPRGAIAVFSIDAAAVTGSH